MIGTIDCIDVHGNLTELKTAPVVHLMNNPVPAIIRGEMTARGYVIESWSRPVDCVNGVMMYQGYKELPDGRVKTLLLGYNGKRYVAQYE